MPGYVASDHRWLRNYARIGIASLALLYLLSGCLTAMAALGLGGQKADQQAVFPYVLHRPFGGFALCFLIAGMGGYVIWRLYQAWNDPSRVGSGIVGLAIRAGYLVSATFYTGLAVYAVRTLVNGGRDRNPEMSTEVAGTLMQQWRGQWLVWAVALGLFIAAWVQVFRACSGRFQRRIPNPEVYRRHHSLIRWTGGVGFAARGVVLFIISYLFWKAGLQYDPAEAGDTGGAWSFLETVPHGSALLAMVASGFAAYGLFLCIQAWSLQEDLCG